MTRSALVGGGRAGANVTVRNFLCGFIYRNRLGRRNICAMGGM